MSRVGCLFGTFDPIHIGHLIIAQHMLNFAGLDEVHIVVSPQNPFKQHKQLTDDKLRLRMVDEAVKEVSGISASDVEFNLPKPSYTSNTLAILRESYPKKSFDLIMGSDNLAGFHHWHESAQIIEKHRVLVYPRPGLDEHISNAQFQGHPSIDLVNAPLLDISATRIREMMRNGSEIRFLVTEPVRELIVKNNLYSK